MDTATSAAAAAGAASQAGPRANPEPCSPPTVVLVATPLLGRDAPLLRDWAAAIDAVAAGHPAFAFLRCAAVRAGDGPAAQACTDACVAAVEVPWYDVPGEGGLRRGRNAAGIVLKRLRLTRRAVEVGAAVVWFVNVDVRVRAEHWAAADRVFREERAVAVIPYPVRWLAGHSPAVCLARAGPAGVVLELHDARCFRSSEGATSAVIAGGSLGCTAILTAVAAAVPFVLRDPAASALRARSEDVGWFLSAARARVEVRMPLGVVAEHVGCEPAPLEKGGLA